VRIATSSNSAYGIPAIRSNVARQSGDVPGPFTMMETVEQAAGAGGSGNSGKTRIVIVGTQSFAENRTLPPNSNDANLELALGSFQWLAGQDALIALPPKPARSLPLSLTQDQQSTLIFITVVLMPSLIVLAGVVVWWRRRVFV
jgi:ABC-2 type transport system permease protein